MIHAALLEIIQEITAAQGRLAEMTQQDLGTLISTNRSCTPGLNFVFINDTHMHASNYAILKL